MLWRGVQFKWKNCASRICRETFDVTCQKVVVRKSVPCKLQENVLTNGHSDNNKVSYHGTDKYVFI